MITPLVLFTISVFGLSYITGRARVSLALRTLIHARGLAGKTLVEMLECPACQGFWLGAAFSALCPRYWFASVCPFALPPDALTAENITLWLPIHLAFGCYCCGVGYLLGRATGWLKEE